MAKKKKKKIKAPGMASVRASISFPSNIYGTLESIAREKKVSLAWVAREAVDTYLGQKRTLFKGQE